MRKRDWGGSVTSRLSGVSRTVTPASTLPTVNETSMVVVVASMAGVSGLLD